MPNLSDLLKQLIESKLRVTDLKNQHPDWAEVFQALDEYLSLFEKAHSILSGKQNAQ